MISYSRDDIKRAFIGAGLRRGQVIYVQSDLTTPGRLEGCRRREDFCAAYFDAVFEVIGPEGTLVVPTYSTQVARFDIDFVLEETPSLMGIFSEYVRQKKGSVRSPHPLHSLTAFGARKDAICRDVGCGNFGFDSPFWKLLEEKAKILAIGLDSGYAVGIAHFVETVCGLPYVYNKLLKWAPTIRGKKDPRPYYASVRYLDLDIEHDLGPWAAHIKKMDGLKVASLGAAKVYMADYETVFNEGVKLLRQNPYFLLKNPPVFQYGKIPFDGPTAQQDNIAAADDQEKLKKINWLGYYTLSRPKAGGD